MAVWQKPTFNIVKEYPSNLKKKVKVKVAQLCTTLCDPMNHSMPSLSVHHQLLEFTQTHVHRVSDAIQHSSHTLVK